MDIRWLTVVLHYPHSAAGHGEMFWQAVSGAPVGPDRLDATGDPHLRVEPFEGPPGHQLEAGVTDVRRATTQAVALGATVAGDGDRSVDLDTPNGLRLRLVRATRSPVRAAPVTWPGGHRSTVDQICLDVVPDGYVREVGFWQQLTGWEQRSGSRPEFEFLVRPVGFPVRILVQLLADDPGPSRMHLDLACDDVAAEQSRHEALGAVPIRTMPDWVTLLDPGGLPYCITRRHPDTGLLG